jgi:hypothetical protein
MPDMELSFMVFPGNDFAGPHQYVTSAEALVE